MRNEKLSNVYDTSIWVFSISLDNFSYDDIHLSVFWENPYFRTVHMTIVVLLLSVLLLNLLIAIMGDTFDRV